MKKFMKKLAKKTEGFTLVELIVVIAILGILAGIAVPAYSGYLTKAQTAADITTLSSVKTAAMGACAEDGAVTKIVATESAVTVWLDGTEDDTPAVDGTVLTANADFLLFMGLESYSIDLETGTTATWPNADGEWTIS